MSMCLNESCSKRVFRPRSLKVVFKSFCCFKERPLFTRYILACAQMWPEPWSITEHHVTGSLGQLSHQTLRAGHTVLHDAELTGRVMETIRNAGGATATAAVPRLLPPRRDSAASTATASPKHLQLPCQVRRSIYKFISSASANAAFDTTQVFGQHACQNCIHYLIPGQATSL